MKRKERHEREAGERNISQENMCVDGGKSSRKWVQKECVTVDATIAEI